MSISAAIDDSLLRQAFGGQARRSFSQHTVHIRLGASQLCVPVPRSLPYLLPYYGGGKGGGDEPS
jgi:hypothetical protein